ncbi:cysteine-rich repeat secretory protein 38-like [Populus alba x Populus x berolinensis]|uniref:Cysteine-rich repeat secretory protein 38-like n=1 Tax=Populus alba x Populus x berolinensis TaxID=444605 RepID=A0AAD6QJ78_9ROSI|nr:cysteine-rich repeat secretory protein 38-like [Populus alba x Populus x berolinensis]
MSSSNFASFLCLLAFSLLVHTENFTANGPYESNLNKLAGYLYYQAPSTGFGQGSIGQNPDQAYGLALCRGKTKELLTQLANKVQATPKLYETGEMELGESTKLYGLVQCTRDLSSAVCKKCLDGIIGELPSCCDGKEGGRVVSGSCNFRYEIYPFVNA